MRWPKWQRPGFEIASYRSFYSCGKMMLIRVTSKQFFEEIKFAKKGQYLEPALLRTHPKTERCGIRNQPSVYGSRRYEMEWFGGIRTWIGARYLETTVSYVCGKVKTGVELDLDAEDRGFQAVREQLMEKCDPSTSEVLLVRVIPEPLSYTVNVDEFELNSLVDTGTTWSLLGAVLL